MTRRAPVAVAIAVAAGFGIGHLTNADAVKTPSLLGYTIQTRDATNHTQFQPADNQWYNLGGHLVVQPGVWRLSYRAVVYSARPQTDTGTVDAIATLATSPSAQTDADLTAVARVGGNSFRLMATLTGEKVVAVKQPTTYYLNVEQSSGNGWDQLETQGSWSPTVIRAERVQ